MSRISYDEMFLSDAMKNLGEAFSYAYHYPRLSLGEFAQLFIISGYAKQFGDGCPYIVLGHSGVELCEMVLEKTGMDFTYIPPKPEYTPGREYWCGWILAYYQWKSGDDFRTVFRQLPLSQVEKMYQAYHQASEDKFYEDARVLIEKQKADVPSRLQQYRRLMAYSQRTLSEKSGVNLRTLQQYETGAKDLKKAAGETLLALADTLHCEVRDLI